MNNRALMSGACTACADRAGRREEPQPEGASEELAGGQPGPPTKEGWRAERAFSTSNARDAARSKFGEGSARHAGSSKANEGVDLHALEERVVPLDSVAGHEAVDEPLVRGAARGLEAPLADVGGRLLARGVALGDDLGEEEDVPAPLRARRPRDVADLVDGERRGGEGLLGGALGGRRVELVLRRLEPEAGEPLGDGEELLGGRRVRGDGGVVERLRRDPRGVVVARG